MDHTDFEEFKKYILSVILEMNTEQNRRTEKQIAALRDEMKEKLDAVMRLWSKTRRDDAAKLQEKLLLRERERTELRHGGAGGDGGGGRPGRREEKQQQRGDAERRGGQEEEEEGVQVDMKLQERSRAESHHSAGAVEKMQTGANKQGLLLLQLLSKSQNHIRRLFSKLPWNKGGNDEERYRYVKYENEEKLQKRAKITMLEKLKRQLMARKKGGKKNREAEEISWKLEKSETGGEEIEEGRCNLENRSTARKRREKEAQKLNKKEEREKTEEENENRSHSLREKRKKMSKVKEKKRKSLVEELDEMRKPTKEKKKGKEHEEKQKKMGSSKEGDWASESSSSCDFQNLEEIKTLLSKKNEIEKDESDIISHLINECEAEILKFEMEILEKSKREGQRAGRGDKISDIDVCSDLDSECENFRKMFAHE